MILAIGIFGLSCSDSIHSSTSSSLSHVSTTPINAFWPQGTYTAWEYGSSQTATFTGNNSLELSDSTGNSYFWGVIYLNDTDKSVPVGMIQLRNASTGAITNEPFSYSGAGVVTLNGVSYTK
jgi:hypothetical protein